MEWMIPKGIQFWIITTLLFETFCAPLEDPEVPTFSLELQTPLEDNYNDAKDSYGNPIQFSKTIDTPDGRKVISAKGFQFEIPDYASGITDIRQPPDDLLPPFLGESNDFDISEDNKFSESTLSYQTQAPPQLLEITNAPTQAQTPIQTKIQIRNLPTQKLKPQFQPKHPQEQKLKLERQSRTIIPLSNGNFNYANIPKDQLIINKIASKYRNPLPTLEPIAVALPDDTETAESSDNGNIQSQPINVQPEISSSTDNGRYTGGFGGPPGVLGQQKTIGTYYQNQIATAQEINNIPVTIVVEPSSDSNINSEPIPMIPVWLADYKDPDLGPPVPYIPSEMGKTLNFLSYGLVPPLLDDLSIQKDIAKKPEGVQNRFQSVDNVPTTSKSTQFNNGQTAQTIPKSTTYTTQPTTTPTTPKTTTTQTTTKPTTTKPTTTKPTTTKPTTTTSTTTTTTTTTTARTTIQTTTSPKPLVDDFLMLENGNTGNLPEWLIDFNDPDVGSAVDFVIPADLNEYNHTIVASLLPPLSPFEDLKIINISPPLQKPLIGLTDNINRPQKINVQIERQDKNTVTTLPTNTITQSIKEINKNMPQQSTSVAQSTLTSFNPSTNPIKAVTEPADPRNQSTIVPINSDTVTSAVSPNTAVAPPQASAVNGLPEIIENPFNSATIPPWLLDLNDPDVGPGVPFVYVNPDSKEKGSVIPSLPVAVTESLKQPSDGQPAKVFTPPPVTEATITEESTKFNSISGQTNVLNNNKDGFSNNKGFISNSIFATQPTQRPSVFGQTSSFASRFPTQQTLTTKSTFGKPFGNTAFPSSFGNKFGTNLKPKPTTSLPIDNDSGKYTGGFGGAPGLLGQQIAPGFAVRPDGSINDPDHTYRPPGGVAPIPSATTIAATTSSPKPINSVTQSNNNYELYTGGFGGPPGVLIPYDNVRV